MLVMSGDFYSSLQLVHFDLGCYIRDFIVLMLLALVRGWSLVYLPWSMDVWVVLCCLDFWHFGSHGHDIFTMSFCIMFKFCFSYHELVIKWFQCRTKGESQSASQTEKANKLVNCFCCPFFFYIQLWLLARKKNNLLELSFDCPSAKEL